MMLIATLMGVVGLGMGVKLGEMKERDVGVQVPEPQCFMVTRNGTSSGPIVKHVTHYDQIYFQLNCPQPGSVTTHCLIISNCTMTSGGQGIPIIDEQGCSLHPSLFKDIEYEGDLKAGFLNPYPVRLRGSNTFVSPQCKAQLRAKPQNSRPCSSLRPVCLRN